MSSEFREYSGHVCQHWKVQKATDELAVGCELRSQGESAMRGTDVWGQVMEVAARDSWCRVFLSHD